LVLIRLDPRLADAYANRGLVRDHLGQYALAIADDERATELDTRDFNSHNSLAWLWPRVLKKSTMTVSARSSTQRRPAN
jgi:tetratricopeptide (TPR) repeat protein